MNFYAIPSAFNTPLAGLSRTTPNYSSQISRELINGKILIYLVISQALTMSISCFQTKFQQQSLQSKVESLAKPENKDC